MPKNNVVELADFRPAPDPEAVAVCRFLERLAATGRVKDLAIAFKLDGEDLHAFTGVFKSDGLVAATAANWLSVKLNEAAGILPKGGKKVG